MNNNKKLTLKAMAQRLQVSTATVSNAFNRPDQLSEERRQWILEECRRAGYAGPHGGRHRLSGRSGIVGLMLAENLSASLSDPALQAFLNGLSVELDRQQCNLLLLPNNDAGSEYRRRQHESLVDGFIVWGTLRRADTLERLRLLRKRVVAVDAKIPGFPSVTADHYGGAHAAAMHALREPVSGVAILGLRLIDSDRVCRVRPEELSCNAGSAPSQRLQGFLDALRECGHALPVERIWHLPDSGWAAAMQAAREALTSHPRPELVLCMSDQMARAVIGVAAELGLGIPDDVRVLGFEGAESGPEALCELTTVEQPFEQQGQLAARLYLGELADADMVLPTQLKIGRSCP